MTKIHQNEIIKNQLINQAFQIEALLKRYIDIHNRRLKSAGTFTSLFRKVNFEEIYRETEELQGSFREKMGEIFVMRKDFSKYTLLQQNFFDTLNAYFSALFEAVEMLYQITKRQYDLSQGLGKTKLTLLENLNLERKYQEKERAYYALGGRLNETFDCMKQEAFG